MIMEFLIFAAILVVLFLIFKVKVKHEEIKKDIQINNSGKEGETKVSVVLERLQGNDGVLLNDVMIDLGNGKTTQIDHILIKSTGIYVIETKNCKGKIYGNEKSYQWTRCLGKTKIKFYNPCIQNSNHIAHLKKFVKANDNQWVNIVVFSNINCDISSVKSKTAIRLNELEKRIKSCGRASKQALNVQKTKQSILEKQLDNNAINKAKHIENVKRAMAISR